jgi:SAM-dependent methyltransferase
MLVKLLLQAGIEAVGADLEPESFRVPGQACVFADLNARLPFPDESFDGFACIEGIEHIENPHLLAREAARILRPRGRLYISTPNVLSIRSRLSYLFRGYPDQFHYMIEVDEVTGRERPIAHINPVGMLELRYVLARAGLDVVRIEANRLRHTGSPWYRFLRWWMQSRGRRAARAHERVAAVRRHLLSDAVLFGEGLIVTAVKAAAPPSVGP